MGNNDSKLEENQEICVQKVQEKPYDVTNQYDVQSLSDRDGLIGDHETQLVETSEADLHIYLKNCKKNPGHKEFIPVETFSLEHLPVGHRDNDLFEYTKATAELTVRVDVRIISQNRPEVWPKTNFPYPFYNMINSTKLRTGSGRIHNVLNFTDGIKNGRTLHRKNLKNCWCQNCEGSYSPSNVWWEFYVYTATHVVFDDIEASKTSLRLFYDRNDSPVVSVDKVSVVHVDIEGDTCWLNCVTCDKHLGNKLQEMDKHYEDVWWKVRNKYKNSRDAVQLTCIVSHPHGCSKQVSVGHWKDKYKVDARLNKFTYTTCTCPGSSGAHVNCVGYDTGGFFELVHSGSLNSGLNLSGAGCVD